MRIGLIGLIIFIVYRFGETGKHNAAPPTSSKWTKFQSDRILAWRDILRSYINLYTFERGLVTDVCYCNGFSFLVRIFRCAMRFQYIFMDDRLHIIV